MAGRHWEPPARAWAQRALAPLPAARGSSCEGAWGSLGERALSPRIGPGTFYKLGVPVLIWTGSGKCSAEVREVLGLHLGL